MRRLTVLTLSIVAVPALAFAHVSVRPSSQDTNRAAVDYFGDSPLFRGPRRCAHLD